MGMAASVEVRVPLLDDELVDLAARIPSRLKLKGWRRKYIFKSSQEGTLPRAIVWRRKAGFGAPIRSWLAEGADPLVADLLSEETIRRRGLVRPETVATAPCRERSGSRRPQPAALRAAHARALAPHIPRPHMEVRHDRDGAAGRIHR